MTRHYLGMGEAEIEWEPLEHREPNFYDEVDIDSQVISLETITSPELIEMFAGAQTELRETESGPVVIRHTVVDVLRRPSPNLPRPRVGLHNVAFEAFGQRDKSHRHYDHIRHYMDWLSLIDPEVERLNGSAYRWERPKSAPREYGGNLVFPLAADVEAMLRDVIKQGREIKLAELNRRNRR